MKDDNLNSSKLTPNPIYTGIVIDRETDPQSLGRVKVEVIGLHDGDRKVAPDDLPFAYVLSAGNSHNTFSSIKIGEWVSLYFLDEGIYRYPVVIGVIPGLNPSTTRLDTMPPIVTEPLPLTGGTPTTNLPGASTPSPLTVITVSPTQTIPTVNLISSQPAPSPAVNNGGQAHTSSTPLLSRLTIGGVRQTQNDIIGVMDSFRDHVCSVTSIIAYKIADIRQSIEDFIGKVRDAIINAILGESSPIVSAIKNAISWIQARIRFIRKLARAIQESLFYVLQLINEIQQLIEFILSLPERLLAIFLKCLNEALGELGNLVQFATQFVTDPFSVADSFIQELIAEADIQPGEETETEKSLLSSISNFNQQLIGPQPTSPGIP